MIQIDEEEKTTVEKEPGKPALKPRTKTLQDRINEADEIQGRRFGKLRGEALDIATEGIVRHMRACDRLDVKPDVFAIREIIDDALNGRRFF